MLLVQREGWTKARCSLELLSTKMTLGPGPTARARASRTAGPRAPAPPGGGPGGDWASRGGRGWVSALCAPLAPRRGLRSAPAPWLSRSQCARCSFLIPGVSPQKPAGQRGDCSAGKPAMIGLAVPIVGASRSVSTLP